MKKKTTMIVAAIALAAVAAAPALAYRSGGGPHNRGPVYSYGMAGETRGLDLTDGQTQKIRDLREAHLKEIKPLQDQLYAKGRELRNLWLARTPDQEKIQAIQKEVRALQDQLADKEAAFQSEASKVLTPEQLAKARAYSGKGRAMTRGGIVMPTGNGAGMRGGFTPGRGMR